MQNGKVTLKEVAAQAGVSKMTVSAVLNGDSAHVRVSEATRLRVREAARILGYQPNALARSLRRRRTDVIGVYYGFSSFQTNARIPFHAEIIGGLQEGCERHRKDLLLHSISHLMSVENIYTQLLDGRIDGVIVYSPPEDPLALRLATSSLPAVAIVDRIPVLPSVLIDNASGSQMLAKYLAERGHRQILYRKYSMPLESVEARYEAFREAAADLGMCVTDWTVPVQLPVEDDTIEQIRAMSPTARPDAIVCWNDYVAYETLSRCRQVGLRVPEEIAVVGFDGLSTPGCLAQRLTTISAAWPQVACTAVDLLVAQINGETIPQETYLPVSLLHGDTA